MSDNPSLILGEFRRAVDERYRFSIPAELLEPLIGDASEAVLVKERPGSLSLWSTTQWKTRLKGAVGIVESKWQAGRLDSRIHDVQRLGRLLSTRHREIQLAGRGRLVVPEGFREFLDLQPGTDVMLVGAGVCIEIWHPTQWINYLNQGMEEFGPLLDELSG